MLFRSKEVLPKGGWNQETPYTGRGAAFGDLDLDGDIDLVVFNCEGPAKLLVNGCANPGASVSVRLLDRAGRDAEGARIEGKVGGRSIHRFASRHYSYCVSNSPRLHIGLGNAPALSQIRIHWPNGETSEHGDLSAGSRVEIRQP